MTGVIGVLYVRRYFKGSDARENRRSKRSDLAFQIASLFSFERKQPAKIRKKSRTGLWSWQAIVIIFMLAFRFLQKGIVGGISAGSVKE